MTVVIISIIVCGLFVYLVATLIFCRRVCTREEVDALLLDPESADFSSIYPEDKV
jgi:hypothetical protein